MEVVFHARAHDRTKFCPAYDICNIVFLFTLEDSALGQLVVFTKLAERLL